MGLLDTIVEYNKEIDELSLKISLLQTSIKAIKNPEDRGYMMAIYHSLVNSLEAHKRSSEKLWAIIDDHINIDI